MDLQQVDTQPNVAIPDVNIMNVLNTDPSSLAQWVAVKLLNIRLPMPGPNQMLNVNEILPLMPMIANRISFATELYVQCAGAKPAYTKLKKNPDHKSEAEDCLAVIASHLDMLYRAIQTLEAQRESASRMITGSNNLARVLNG